MVVALIAQIRVHIRMVNVNVYLIITWKMMHA